MEKNIENQRMANVVDENDMPASGFFREIQHQRGQKPTPPMLCEYARVREHYPDSFEGVKPIVASILTWRW